LAHSKPELRKHLLPLVKEGFLSKEDLDSNQAYYDKMQESYLRLQKMMKLHKSDPKIYATLKRAVEQLDDKIRDFLDDNEVHKYAKREQK
jgi:C-terminal processing protease CtpA/Prc